MQQLGLTNVHDEMHVTDAAALVGRNGEIVVVGNGGTSTARLHGAVNFCCEISVYSTWLHVLVYMVCAGCVWCMSSKSRFVFVQV